MMFLLILCATLITAGATLECEVCYAINSNNCPGHYEKCDSEQSRCIVTLTQTSLGNLRNAVLEKSCGSLYKCTHPATLTTHEYRVSVNTMCCDEDYCNNGTMNWKAPNETFNGLICESCFERDFQPCDRQKTVNCTGDENHCIEFSVTKHRGSTITLAGCASESMVQSKGKAAFWGSSVYVSGFQNRNRGESLQHGLLLPLLAVMTIMKTMSVIL
ncbi:phospholipase A2 inhibitor and Ly6/PLAUR domain-containing protein-like [Rhinophrynus dorsalis]